MSSGVSGLFENAIASVAQWMIGGLFQAADLLFQSKLLSPCCGAAGTLTQATGFPSLWPTGVPGAATSVRDIAMALIVMGIAWVGLRIQLGRAAQLSMRGASIERIVIAFLLCVSSFTLCGWLLDVNNLILQYFVSLAGVTGLNPLSPLESVSAAIGTSATGAATGLGVSLAGLTALILMVAVGAALALYFVFTYYVREAEIVFFAVTMPLWSALYAFDETSGMMGSALRELAAAIFTQTIQVLIMWLGSTVFFSGSSAAPAGFGALLGYTMTALAIFYLMFKAPRIMRQLVGAGFAGSNSFVSDAMGTASKVAGLIAMFG